MSPTLPSTPASTTTYTEAVAAGFWGLRTDPLPDQLYDATSAVGQPPQLTSCQPTSGPAAGGTTLNLGGSGLAGVLLVAVGQQPATAVTVDDDSKVTAQTPPGAGSGLTVTVADASGQSSLAGIFNYDPPIDG